MSQKALIVQEIGKPAVLTQKPIPSPKENEVLVKVVVAGISPHNQLSRDVGLFIGENLPQGLFQDNSGVVTELGPGVTKFAVGDRVFNQGFFMGEGVGSQEYSIMEVDLAAKIPEALSFDDVATLPVNTIAAFSCLFHSKGLEIPPPFPSFQHPGSAKFPYDSTTVVILGGGSACGKLVVRFASMAKIGRIIAVASPGNEAQLKEFGATHFVDRRSEKVVEDIRDIVGDELIYVVDTVNYGEGGMDLVLKILSNSKKGRYVSLLPGSPSEAVSKSKSAGYDGGFLLAASKLLKDLSVQFWTAFPEWLEKGEIKPYPFQVIEGLDAEKINTVLDRYRDGKGVEPKVNIHL